MSKLNNREKMEKERKGKKTFLYFWIHDDKVGHENDKKNPVLMLRKTMMKWFNWKKSCWID